MSVAALADVLQDIRINGMPEGPISRSSIKRARDDTFEEESKTPYGMVLNKFEAGKWADDGTAAEFWIADPGATMYHYIRACPKFESFIRAGLALHPCDMNHPWTVILYNDEITPGAALKHHNQRKVHAHYWSFLEFGIEALTSEFLWFTLHIVRSDFVASLDGRGAGQICKHMILSFADCGTEGFQYLDIVLWFKVGKLVADESALKQSLDVKGATGAMCCLKCRNVVSKVTFGRMTRAEANGMVCITCVDVTKFKRHSDNTIIANAHFLDHSAGSIAPEAFKKLEIALGLVYAPDGVLLCTGFDPQSGVCFDYRHVYFVKGIFNIEAGLLLDLLKSRELTGRRITHSEIHRFFEGFTWPHHSNAGKSICEKRSDDGGPLACSASEALGSFALLQYFLCLQVFPYANDRVKRACVCFYALCAVVEALSMTARGSVPPAELRKLIVEHLKLFKLAYGDDAFVPKFHFALHLPEQLARWSMLVACWCHERKHKEAKRYLDLRHNRTANYDRNVMQDVLHIQKLALQEEFPYPSSVCLLREHKAPMRLAKEMQAAYGSQDAVFSAVSGKASAFVTCHVNDVVYARWTATTTVVCQIRFLSKISGTCWACLTVWTKLPQLNMYDCSGDNYLLPLSVVLDTCIYSMRGSVAFVLPPRCVRA